MSSAPLDQNTFNLITRLSADLQRRSGELDAILNVLPIGIGISADPECRNIRINRAFAEQLGISVSQNASLSAPVEERPPFKVLRDGRELTTDELPMQYAARHAIEVHNAEIDVRRPDGLQVSLAQWAAPLFDEAGAVRGAIAASMDITERRRSEQEQRFLADASRVLASSLDYEETLSALARLALPTFGDYCAVDVVRDDASFARIEFATIRQDKQQIADALRRYPPVLRVESPAVQVIRTGEPLLAPESPPEVVARSAQSPEHLRLMSQLDVRCFMMVPLRARGRTLGLLTVGICGDNCRKYDERDLRFASEVGGRAGLALDNALLYRDAQEANRLKEDFLATLSHELRTPLNALVGWTHMLKTRPLDDVMRRRALDSIERNAAAQAVLINDLLDVSRVVSGKLRLETQAVDLPAVVLAAVDAVKPAVRAREIDLAISVAPLAGKVMGDADRLRQVVWNLLSNAVKFTQMRGRVEVVVEQTGGAVQVSVADNGVGIDRAFLPYVFDRFRQGDSSTTRMHSGLGLGLAIVRHLVDLHGGTVTVESSGPGKGSRFVVTLPLVSALHADIGAPQPRAVEPSSELRGVRVLAVDDDPDSRELMLLLIQSAGGEVMAVSSAPAALDALETFRPHVVVADLAMPDMDGFTLMREITLKSDPPPPAVALSAYVAGDDVRRALDAGFAFHLGKPPDYDRLVRAIADLAGGRSSEESQESTKYEV